MPLDWGTQQDWEDATKTDVKVVNDTFELADATVDEQNLAAQWIADSYELNDGDSISSSWVDSAGQNDASVNGSPIYRSNQLNGYPAVDLDGTDDWFNTGIQQDTTASRSVYVVFSVQNYNSSRPSAWYSAIDTDSTTNRFYNQTRNSSEFQPGYGDTSVNGGTPPSTNTYIIVSSIFDSGTGELYRNDATNPTVSFSYGGVGQLGYPTYIGTRNSNGTADLFGDFRIVELRDYSTGHGDTTRQDVVASLNDKYGVF